MSESLGAMDVAALANAIVRHYDEQKGFAFFTLFSPVNGKKDVFANPRKISGAGLTAANMIAGTPVFIEVEEGDKSLRVKEIFAFHSHVMPKQSKPVGGKKPNKQNAAKQQKRASKPTTKTDSERPSQAEQKVA